MVGEQIVEEVRDPVCGMMIEPQNAVSHQENVSKTYYFCNRSCATKFAANPQAFLHLVTKAATRTNHCIDELTKYFSVVFPTGTRFLDSAISV